MVLRGLRGGALKEHRVLLGISPELILQSEPGVYGWLTHSEQAQGIGVGAEQNIPIQGNGQPQKMAATCVTWNPALSCSEGNIATGI